GRAAELAVLRTEHQRSVLGELRVVLVLGGAGLGKTWLATELLSHDDDTAIGLIAHSDLFIGMPPFAPWADTLGFRASEANRVSRVCGSGLGGLPSLVRRGDITHDATACADARRYHFVQWIPALLATLSAERPIVVLLDDVHSADNAVWEMVLRLARDHP